LVEDDEAIASPLVRALQREKHEVTLVDNGLAVSALAEGTDVIILDLGLPGKDGLNVCRELRAAKIDVPIVMLSARAEEIDLIIGLDAGADDYVTKPFRTSELMARVRAALRRRSAPGTSITVGDLTVDAGIRAASYAGEVLALTPKEFDLLFAMAQHFPNIISRDQLLKEVWQTDWIGASKTIDMHISTLRRKLAEAGANKDVIATVRGSGFRLTKA
jgi:DNA-binding response OmpR family regulator